MNVVFKFEGKKSRQEKKSKFVHKQINQKRKTKILLYYEQTYQFSIHNLSSWIYDKFLRVWCLEWPALMWYILTLNKFNKMHWSGNWRLKIFFKENFVLTWDTKIYKKNKSGSHKSINWIKPKV